MISRRTSAILVAFSIAATALPSEHAQEHVAPYDDASPEGEMIEVSARAEAMAEAQAQVNALLAAGKSDTACRNLAAATIKSTEESVTAQQDILKKLPTGKTCKDQGQGAVTAAKNAKNAADKKLTDAKKAAADALKAPIKVETTYGSVKDAACVVSKSNGAFKTAKAAHDAAAKAVLTAQGEANGAKKSLDAAIDAAKNEKQACLCRVQNQHKVAWAAANKNNAENDKAYRKAKNMECVLDGTAVSQCKQHSAPKVTEPSVEADVKNANCGEAKVEKPKTQAGFKVHASCKKEHTNLSHCIGDISKGGKGNVRAFIPAKATDTLGQCRYKKCGTSNWIKWSGGKMTYKDGRALCAGWGRNNENYVWEVEMNGKIYRSSEANAKARGTNVQAGDC